MPFAKIKSLKIPLIGVLALASGITFLTFGTPEGGCGAEFSDVELATSYENQAQALECYAAQDGKYSCDFYPQIPLGALAVQTSIHFHPALKFKTMRCDTEEACTKIAGSHDVSMHATNTQVNFVVFSLNNDVLPNDLSFQLDFDISGKLPEGTAAVNLQTMLFSDGSGSTQGFTALNDILPPGQMRQMMTTGCDCWDFTNDDTVNVSDVVAIMDLILNDNNDNNDNNAYTVIHVVALVEVIIENGSECDCPNTCWRNRGEISAPQGATASHPVLLAADSQPYLAFTAGNQVHVYALTGDSWTAVGAPLDGSFDGGFALTGPAENLQPTVALTDADGASWVYRGEALLGESVGSMKHMIMLRDRDTGEPLLVGSGTVNGVDGLHKMRYHNDNAAWESEGQPLSTESGAYYPSGYINPAAPAGYMTTFWLDTESNSIFYYPLEWESSADYLLSGGPDHITDDYPHLGVAYVSSPSSITIIHPRATPESSISVIEAARDDAYVTGPQLVWTSSEDLVIAFYESVPEAGAALKVFKLANTSSADGYFSFGHLADDWIQSGADLGTNVGGTSINDKPEGPSLLSTNDGLWVAYSDGAGDKIVVREYVCDDESGGEEGDDDDDAAGDDGGGGP